MSLACTFKTSYLGRVRVSAPLLVLKVFGITEINFMTQLFPNRNCINCITSFDQIPTVIVSIASPASTRSCFHLIVLLCLFYFTEDLSEWCFYMISIIQSYALSHPENSISNNKVPDYTTTHTVPDASFTHVITSSEQVLAFDKPTSKVSFLYPGISLWFLYDI